VPHYRHLRMLAQFFAHAVRVIQSSLPSTDLIANCSWKIISMVTHRLTTLVSYHLLKARPSPILSIARQRNSAVTPGKLLHGKDIYIYALNRKWDTDDMLHQTELSGISNRKSGTTRIVNGPAYQIR
jgi:hypothetical protein